MIKKTTFKALRNENREALVFLGCGGDLTEWVAGTLSAIRENGSFGPEVEYAGTKFIKTTGGRTDLVCFLPKGGVNIGSLAIWRVGYGDCSWLSDYLTNYRDQHEAA